MSPAISELTVRAPPPPMITTSTSAPYFLKNPFSSATQTLPFVALIELRPILIFSCAREETGNSVRTSAAQIVRTTDIRVMKRPPPMSWNRARAEHSQAQAKLFETPRQLKARDSSAHPVRGRSSATHLHLHNASKNPDCLRSATKLLSKYALVGVLRAAFASIKLSCPIRSTIDCM